jgi:hypothetical protein
MRYTVLVGNSACRKSVRKHRSYRAIAVVVALISSALYLLAGRGAGAAGGDNPAAVMLQRDIPSGFPPPVAYTPMRGHTATHHKQAAHRDPRPTEVIYAGAAVCVRLCDGSYFPSATSSGGDAACQAQCPDAPTAMYTLRPGSDKIENAVSIRGTLYSALPVAGRYQTVSDQTCSCHRTAPSYLTMALHDPTLRNGDAVMTPTGIVIFKGATARGVHATDFVAVAQARELAKDIRTSLAKLQSTLPDPGVSYASTLQASGVSPKKRASVWVESP